MINVSVTESDIERGVLGAITGCPIALAIRRARPRSSVSVTHHTVKIDGKILALPISATEFMRSFDLMGHCNVRPFTFEIQEELVAADSAARSEGNE